MARTNEQLKAELQRLFDESSSGTQVLFTSPDLVAYARNIVKEQMAIPISNGLEAVMNVEHLFALTFLTRVANDQNPHGRIQVVSQSAEADPGSKADPKSRAPRGQNQRRHRQPPPTKLPAKPLAKNPISTADHRGNIKSCISEFGDHIEQWPWEANTMPPPGKLWETKAKPEFLIRPRPGATFDVDHWAPDSDTVKFYYMYSRQGLGYKPVEVLSQGGQGAIVRYEEYDDVRGTKSSRQPRSVVAKLNYRAGAFFDALSGPFDVGDPVLDDEDEDSTVNFVDTFRDEVWANELLGMTGTPHVVRMIGFPELDDTFFFMEHLPLGTLDRYRHDWKLVDVWRLFQCLAKAVAVMAWGSEYPDFRVKKWQQIIHLDLTPENVFVSEDEAPYHSCGAGHNCFKIGDFGYCIIWPTGDTVNNPYEEPNKGLVNPHRMEQVDIEAKRQRYAGRGKTNPPEKEYAAPGRPQTALTQEIAHNYSWWTNVWQIGQIMRSVDFGSVKTDARPTPADTLALDNDPLAGTDQHMTPRKLAELSHLGREAYWREARPVDADLARRRLARLIDRCVSERPTERIAIPELLLEITKGLKEAGGFPVDWVSPPLHWEADGQEEFLKLTRNGIRRDVASTWPSTAARARRLREEVDLQLEHVERLSRIRTTKEKDAKTWAGTQ